jgi:hypothetical protein
LISHTLDAATYYGGQGHAVGKQGARGRTMVPSDHAALGKDAYIPQGVFRTGRTRPLTARAAPARTILRRRIMEWSTPAKNKRDRGSRRDTVAETPDSGPRFLLWRLGSLSPTATPERSASWLLNPDAGRIPRSWTGMDAARATLLAAGGVGTFRHLP